METRLPLPLEPPRIEDLDELGIEEVVGETGEVGCDSLSTCASSSTSMDSSAPTALVERGERRLLLDLCRPLPLPAIPSGDASGTVSTIIPVTSRLFLFELSADASISELSCSSSPFSPSISISSLISSSVSSERGLDKDRGKALNGGVAGSAAWVYPP